MGYGQYTNGTYGNSLAKGEPRKPQRKFVFGSHDQTAHVWAQQNEETLDGRSSDGRMMFRGPTIYSYGTHFPIAHFTGKLDGNGRDVVLYNSQSRSVSTSKHQSIVRGALHGLSVVVVSVPDLQEFLNARGKKLASIKRELFTSACERYAAALIAADGTGSEESYASYAVESAREHLKSLRAIGITADHAPDIRAWYLKRKAKRERAANARKVKAAQDTIHKYDYVAAVASHVPDENSSSYTVHDTIREWERNATAIRSARLVLAKAKRFPRMVKRASTILKIVSASLEPWRAALAGIEARERLQRERAELAELRAFLDENDWDIDGQTRLLWNYETVARLWSVAIREGDAKLADYLGRRVHVTQWRMNVPESYKPHSYGSPRVTLADWRKGKGAASFSDGTGATYLRRKGDTLQTSRGAECPFAHAVLAFRQAQRCRMTGEEWRRNGHSIRVGHFNVDRISSEGELTAGCHTLRFEEMQALAIQETPELVQPRYPLPVPLGV